MFSRAARRREPASASGSRAAPPLHTGSFVSSRLIGASSQTLPPRRVFRREKLPPSLWGGTGRDGVGGGGIQSPGAEWRRSKFGGVVPPLVCGGATECGGSKFLSNLLQPCRTVDSRCSCSSSPAVRAAAAPLKKPEATLAFLCRSLSPARTFLFSTHSLTHGSAGVSCFAPRLPHGAAPAGPRRLGGGEQPNAHLLPKIVYGRGRLLLPAERSPAASRRENTHKIASLFNNFTQ